MPLYRYHNHNKEGGGVMYPRGTATKGLKSNIKELNVSESHTRALYSFFHSIHCISTTSALDIVGTRGTLASSAQTPTRGANMNLSVDQLRAEGEHYVHWT